jgi:hypothetical protein
VLRHALSAADASVPLPQSGTGQGGDPENYIFAQDAVRHYEIEVDPDAWAHLKETAYLEEYIPGQLKFQDQVYPIALRFKGFRGSLYSCFRFDEQGNVTERVCDKMPLKVAFDEYDDDARFYELKKLNFHVMRNDPSRMRDRLSYAVFRASGVPAPRSVHATLSVNGEATDLYALVEQIDGRFSRNAYAEGGEGNIYKERWPTLSADDEYYVSGLEANKDEAAVGAMKSFAVDLAAATDETIESVLRAHTNFDQLMRYLAIDRAINHWDGPLAFRCRHPEDVPPMPPEVLEAQTPALGWEVCQNKNYYWYEESNSGLLWIVPWDMDLAWNSFGQFPDWNTPPDVCEIQQQGRPPRCDKLINWLATVLRPHYQRAGQELLQSGVLQAATLRSWLEGWYSQVAPFSDSRSMEGAMQLDTQLDARLAAFAADVAEAPELP